jgi:hypothetical protein
VDTSLSFLTWLGSFVLFAAYLAWALIPDSLLHRWGITYYPSKYYAIAIPAYSLSMMCFIIVGYIAWNMVHTLSPEDPRTMCDSAAVRLISAKYIKCGRHDSIPEAKDMDPVDLSRAMAMHNLS